MPVIFINFKAEGSTGGDAAIAVAERLTLTFPSLRQRQRGDVVMLRCALRPNLGCRALNPPGTLEEAYG